MEDICGAMLQVDTRGKIISWNQMAEEVLGYKESEALGKNALEELFMQETGAEMMETALGGSVYYSFESYIKNSSGNMQPVALVASPINEEATGEIIGITVMVSNVLLI